MAEDFVKQKGGKVEEIVISPNAKIVDYSEVPNVKFKYLNDYSADLDKGNMQIWRDLEVEYQKAVNWAKENGYDGIKLPLEGETRIINRNVLQTKSQLTDIWNQANKGDNTFTTQKARYSPLNVGLDDVTTFRRNVIDPDVPKSEFGLNPKDAGKAGGVKASRDIFRAKSIEVAPELRKLGLDYGMAKELEKILKSSAARKNNRQVINFSKLGTTGVGGLISGAPGMIAGFTLEQIVNSPWFIKNASKGLKAALNAKVKTGKVVTFARPAYETGKVLRMTDTED